MSSSRFRLLLALPLVAAGALVSDAGVEHQSPQLAADPIDPFADRDGDLLPDRLEWILMLDPDAADTDRDGTDDFLHAVQCRLAFGDPRSSYGYDHEARVVVHSSPSPSGQPTVWVNLLFRFAGAQVSDLLALAPYFDRWGMRVPIEQLIGAGRTHLVFLPHPTEGLYALCGFELGSEQVLRSLLPCTIGATAVMSGGRTIRSGSYLADVMDRTTTLVPVAVDSAIVQTLAPDAQDDPFWTSSRVCVMRLSVVSNLAGGSLCEVTDANCVSNGRLACPPTCLSSRGHVMFFPDGLGTVTGSGR